MGVGKNGALTKLSSLICQGEFAFRITYITNFVKRYIPFIWSEVHKEDKNYFVHCLTSKPLLVIFFPDLLTEIHTDTSSEGYGAILFKNMMEQIK